MSSGMDNPAPAKWVRLWMLSLRFGHPNPGCECPNPGFGIQIPGFGCPYPGFGSQIRDLATKSKICTSKSRILISKSRIWKSNPGFGHPNLEFGHPNPGFGHPNPGFGCPNYGVGLWACCSGIVRPNNPTSFRTLVYEELDNQLLTLSSMRPSHCHSHGYSHQQHRL